MFCPNCGAQMEDGARFCPACGTAMDAQAGQPQVEQQPQMQQPQGAQSAGGRGLSIRVASLLCYWFSFVGWGVSYMAADNTNPFLRFHLNQALVLWIGGAIAGVLSRMRGIGFLGSILFIGVMVLRIIACIGAYKGETKSAPLLDKFQILK